MTNEPPFISAAYCHRCGGHYMPDPGIKDIDICGVCERAWLGFEVADGY